MAFDPLAKQVTVTYPKGTVTAPYGLFQYLLGDLQLSWQPPSNSQNPDGRRLRKYGARQRASARGGRVMNLVLRSGDTFQCRITGTDTDFIDWILAKSGLEVVLNIYTQRGTIYGPQFPEEATP
jgi:hypothetical protein